MLPRALPRVAAGREARESPPFEIDTSISKARGEDLTTSRSRDRDRDRDVDRDRDRDVDRDLDLDVDRDLDPGRERGASQMELCVYVDDDIDVDDLDLPHR